MTLRRAPVRSLIGGTVLEHAQQIRILRHHDKPTFAPHVDKAVRRGNRALDCPTGCQNGILRPCQSVLECSSVIWTGAAKSHTSVDRVQHKFLCGCYLKLLQDTPVSRLLQHFKIPSLSSRRFSTISYSFGTSLKLDSVLQNCFSLHVPDQVLSDCSPSSSGEHCAIRHFCRCLA